MNEWINGSVIEWIKQPIFYLPVNHVTLCLQCWSSRFCKKVNHQKPFRVLLSGKHKKTRFLLSFSVKVWMSYAKVDMVHVSTPTSSLIESHCSFMKGLCKGHSAVEFELFACVDMNIQRAPLGYSRGGFGVLHAPNNWLVCKLIAFSWLSASFIGKWIFLVCKSLVNRSFAPPTISLRYALWAPWHIFDSF